MQRQMSKLHFDAAKRPFNQPDRARAWIDMEFAPTPPLTDLGRRTSDPFNDAEGGNGLPNRTLKTPNGSKSHHWKDLNRVYLNLQESEGVDVLILIVVEDHVEEPAPDIPERMSPVPEPENKLPPRPFKFLMLLQPGFQQRAAARLQQPEQKAATERRLTEYIAAQQKENAAQSASSSFPSTGTGAGTKNPTAVAAKDQADPPEPIYAEQDPRLTWPQERSAAWRAAKQAEIRRRPGRKARFGRAADSLRIRLRGDDWANHSDKNRGNKPNTAIASSSASAGITNGRTRIEDLPIAIRENEAWMRVMEENGWLETSSSVGTGVGGGSAAASPDKSKNIFKQRRL